MGNGLYGFDLGDIAACVAAIIAFFALLIAVVTAFAQMRHNKLSVRPLAEVEYRDMVNHIRVCLKNNGVGPLIVSSLRVERGGEVIGTSLIECMPESLSKWYFFVGSIDGRSLSSGGEFCLLELKYDNNVPHQVVYADNVRVALKDLVIRVDYMNIYNDSMPAHYKSLSWFARMIE
ncbi:MULTISPECIES: hypothetical protein [Pseudomonas]|uniref:hypothetical protein n=1 Tax=Pseudomonas TaxID=286 RepID=UPI002B4154DF|nr:hypothetical protein [Pseudomonas sichuanensis]